MSNNKFIARKGIEALADSSILGKLLVQNETTLSGLSGTGIRFVRVDATGILSAAANPTTLAGYGITDAASSTHTHTFASLTSKPTTIAGYGITDSIIKQVVSDFNTPTGFAILQAAGATTTNQPASNWGQGIQFSTNNDSNYINQLVFNLSGELYTRTKNNAAWGAWKTIWTSANFTNLNQLTTRNFSDLQNKPTTVSGYGITDAFDLTSAQTVSGYKTYVTGSDFQAETKMVKVYHNSGNFTLEAFNGGGILHLKNNTNDSVVSTTVNGMYYDLSNRLNFSKTGLLAYTSRFTFAGTAQRDYTYPNKNGTFAMLDDIINPAGVYEPVFTKNTGFNKNFGTLVGTVAEGNHTHTFASLTAKPTTIWDHGITNLVVNVRSEADVNTYTAATGFYAAGSTALNRPINYASIISIKNNSDVGFQIAGGYNSDNMYFRGWYGSGTFTAWRAVLHAGNFHVYALPLTGGTLTGALTGTSATFSVNVTGKEVVAIQPGSSPSGSTIILGSPSGNIGLILVRGDGAGGAVRRWDVDIDSTQSLRFVNNTAGSVVPLKIQSDNSVVLSGVLTGTSATFSSTLSASNLSGTNTGDQTDITGNAGTATLAANSTKWNGHSYVVSTTITTPTYLLMYDNTGSVWKPALPATVQTYLGLGSAAYTASTAYYPMSGGDNTGIGRFKGWYTSGLGQALEVGTSGTTSYVLSYNRSTSAYTQLNIDGSAISIASMGGTTTFGGTLTGTSATFSGTVTAPTFSGALSGNATTATTAANATQFGGVGYEGGLLNAASYAMMYNSTTAKWGAASSAQAQTFLGLGNAAYKNESGTWAISVSGNAATATQVPTAYNGGIQLNPQTYFNSTVGLKVAMTGAVLTWSDTLWINGYSGGDVLSMCALHTYRNGQPRMFISTQASTATVYGTAYEFLTGFNYSSFALPLSGGTLTGAINIGGGTTIDGNQIYSPSGTFHVNFSGTGATAIGNGGGIALYGGLTGTSANFTGALQLGSYFQAGTSVSGGYYQDASNGAYRAIGVGGNGGYYFQTNGGSETMLYVGLHGSYAKKVGINTNTPVYTLDIIQPLVAGTDTFATLHLQSANYGYVLSGGIKQNQGAHLAFTYNNNNVMGETMRMTHQGFVGIGNQSPECQLHIGTNDGTTNSVWKTRLVLEPPSHTGAGWDMAVADDPSYAYFAIGYGNRNFSIRNDGQITIVGSVTASGGFFNSDIRLKDLVTSIDSKDITTLKPITYKWKDGRDDVTHLGYSAQEVQSYMPDAILTDKEGYMSVNYVEVLVAKVASLEKRVKELEGRV